MRNTLYVEKRIPNKYKAYSIMNTTLISSDKLQEIGKYKFLK